MKGEVVGEEYSLHLETLNLSPTSKLTGTSISSYDKKSL